jgi:hypothetical protein
MVVIVLVYLLLDAQIIDEILSMARSTMDVERFRQRAKVAPIAKVKLSYHSFCPPLE